MSALLEKKKEILFDFVFDCEQTVFTGFKDLNDILIVD